MRFSHFQSLFIDKFDMHMRNFNEIVRLDSMNAIVERHAIQARKSETVIVSNEFFFVVMKTIGSCWNNSLRHSNGYSALYKHTLDYVLRPFRTVFVPLCSLVSNTMQALCLHGQSRPVLCCSQFHWNFWI